MLTRTSGYCLSIWHTKFDHLIEDAKMHITNMIDVSMSKKARVLRQNLELSANNWLSTRNTLLAMPLPR